MSFIFIILLSFNIFYSTPEQVIFPRFICYESFSSYPLFLKLFIYTYSGPEYISANFFTDVGYYDDGKKHYPPLKKLHFKKINGSCERENIIFTNPGINNSDFKIKIAIFFSVSSVAKITIDYTFKRGFESGKYLLIDKNGNFGISALVTHSGEQLLDRVIDDKIKAYLYLRSIKSSKDHICIVTKNNREVIIQPFYDPNFQIDGYIISILVKLYYPTYHHYEEFEYDAFQCPVPDGYSKQTLFITQENPEVYFYAIYEKVNQFDKTITQIIEFNSTNIEIKTFHPKLITKTHVNKVFLMKSHSFEDICPDGTRVLMYKSNVGQTYYAEKYVDLEVMPNVIAKQWINYPKLNPCE